MGAAKRKAHSPEFKAKVAIEAISLMLLPPLLLYFQE